MRKLLWLLMVLLALSSKARANAAWHDWCWNGGKPTITSGLVSTTLVQASSPQCIVTVFTHGAGLATVYADNANTPLANPFVGQTNGQFIWYAANGRYDQTITVIINGTQQTVTMSDILLCDPAAAGGCGVATGGCTPSGALDTGVISEHPVGSCYDSAHWTWNDATGAQNYQIGLSNTLTQTQSLQFVTGQSNAICATVTSCTQIFVTGSSNTVSGNAAGGSGTGKYDNVYIWGNTNTFTVNDANSILTRVMCLNRLCSVTVDSGANIDDSFMVGESIVMAATGSASSNASSYYSIGEASRLRGISGGNGGDVFQLGEQLITDALNASSSALGIVQLGFGDTVTASNAHSVNHIYQLGDTLNLSDIGGGAAHTVQIGYNNSDLNCTECFLMGENLQTSGVSHIIALGLSATPEFTVSKPDGTHTVVGLVARAFSNLPACSGNEGSFASVTDSTTNTWGATISGSSNLHVLAYCDGTNWTVAGK